MHADAAAESVGALTVILLSTEVVEIMNWVLFRICLLIALLTTTFNLGRLSIEFSGQASDWTLLVLQILVMLASLIGLMAGEIARS